MMKIMMTVTRRTLVKMLMITTIMTYNYDYDYNYNDNDCNDCSDG